VVTLILRVLVLVMLLVSLVLLLLLLLLLIHIVGAYGGGDGISRRHLVGLSIGLGSCILESLSLLWSKAVLSRVGGSLEYLESVARVRVDVDLMLGWRMGWWWG
jgi:hypothetical protein